MILSEATGGAQWSGSDQASALGRPACAAIARSAATSRVTLSLGCIGMRTFTELDSGQMLAVVPGKILDQFSAEVSRLREVNDEMEAFYKERAAGLST